jgi:hypothetical protein
MPLEKRNIFWPLILFASFGAAAFFIYEQATARVQSSESVEGFSQTDSKKAIVDFRFDDSEKLKEWKDREFKGKTKFEIVEHLGEKVLRASSEGTSSALYHQVEVPIAMRPWLTWEWKVTKFPSNKKNKRLADKSDNDYGARVYAIFKSKNDLPFKQDIIQYIWDDYFEEGTYEDSPFLKSVKILVVQKGPNLGGGWVSERRDLYNDYKKLFDREPKRDVVVLGLTSDSDNTGTSSEAFFKGLTIEVLANQPVVISQPVAVEEGMFGKTKNFFKRVVFFWR